MNVYPVEELLNSLKSPEDVMSVLFSPKEEFQAELVMDRAPFAAGGFKTAHHASLIFEEIDDDSDDPKRKRYSNLVGKRPFMPTGKPGGKRRLAFPKEVEEVKKEGLGHIWASTLLDWCMAWLRGRDTPLPAKIPKLSYIPACFVRGTPRRENASEGCLLLEHRIYGTFVKYINNGAAHPVDASVDLTDLLQFLVFVQHWQFWKTGGMAYTSDFQGNEHELTDPQIMTHP